MKKAFTLAPTFCLMVGLAVLAVFVAQDIAHDFGWHVQAASNYNPRNGDPCAINVRFSAPINLLASGQLITGVAGKQTYICSMQFVNAAAQNIALVEGTGSVCGTNTVGMAGGNTAATGWNLGINQAIWLDSPGQFSLVTLTTGDNVCFLLSGTTQVSGFIQYANQ